MNVCENSGLLLNFKLEGEETYFKRAEREVGDNRKDELTNGNLASKS